MNRTLARAHGVPDDVIDALAAVAIEPVWNFHPAAPTVAAAMEHWKDIAGAHAKNLFFKDSGGALWLLTALAARRLDLKGLPKILGSKRLSFGSAPLLEEALGVAPGSVTPLAALRDREKRVTIALDADLMRAETVNVHPLVNTATIGMRPDQLVSFLRGCGHTPRIVELGPL